MFDHLPPEVLIFNFENYGNQYYETIVTILMDGIRDLSAGDMEYMNGHSIIEQVYAESLRQIFDYMNSDFSIFNSNISHGPKFSNFISATTLFTPEKQHAFSELFKQVAVMIWFEMRNLGIFNLQVPYYLDNPARDHLVLRALY